MADKNTDTDIAEDFIDRLYAVAMEPERFHELADIWQMQLKETGHDLGKEYSGNSDILEQHFSRADTILSLVNAHSDSLPQSLQRKLSQEAQAMIAFSVHGDIEALNGAAAVLYGVEEGDSLQDLPFDEIGKNTVKKELRKLLSDPLNSTPNSPELFQVGQKTNDSFYLISFLVWKTRGSRKFLIMQSTDFRWPSSLTPIIKSAFKLTDAEADIVKLIVEGHSVESIAAARKTSLNTVRTQIRSLYDKTSTKNQSEFMRMALGLTNLHMNLPEYNKAQFPTIELSNHSSYPLPEHRRLLSLPGGRILDYAIFGPDDGKPCLFFHHAYYGEVWPKKLAEMAIKNGLRIIIPARGYYGQTSPYPDGVSSYDQMSVDTEMLRQHLELENIVLFSQTTGFDFSVHYASSYPDNVKALVSIAPSLPFKSVKRQDGMPRLAKFMSTIAGRNPRMLEFVAKSGYSYHNKLGSKRFMEKILVQCPTDLKIVKDPNNRDSITRGFQYCTTHGHKGFYYDYLYLLKDKWKRTKTLNYPIWAIIGTDDQNSRHQRLKDLQEADVNIKEVIAQDGGEILLFSHPGLVVETLLQAWE